MNRICFPGDSVLLGVLMTISMMAGCERFEPESILVFRTEYVEELSDGGYKVVGRIINTGDDEIREHGFCWSESNNPTISDAVIRLGSKTSTGLFSGTIRDYAMDRQYFVRAYVTTEEGTEYGKVKTFTTPPPEVPTVVTFPVSSFTGTVAEIGGEVTSEGGAPVTARGICWSTFPEPTLEDMCIQSGSGMGSFTVTVEGLTCSSTFYFRAFATNSAGTAYGEQVDCTTPECVPAEGLFMISDRDGIWMMNELGERVLFNSGGGRNVEVFENRIYLHSGHDVSVYHTDGSLIRSVTIDNLVSYPYGFCVLPGENMAFLDNSGDKVSFTNSAGELIHEMPLSDPPGGNLQSVYGVVVGDKLIISEDGNSRIIRIDLGTFEAEIFRDLQHLTGWLGDIDFRDGTYYVCQSMKLQAFGEDEGDHMVCQLPEGNNTGVAVQGDFAYVISNFGNKVYRINIWSGDYDVLVDDLNYPQDIELLE